MNSRLCVDYGLTAGDIFLWHAHLLSVELDCPFIPGESFGRSEQQGLDAAGLHRVRGFFLSLNDARTAWSKTSSQHSPIIAAGKMSAMGGKLAFAPQISRSYQV